MNNFKRVLSLVIMLAMLVPLASVVSFAEDTDLEANWYTLAAKYSSSTDKIIAPQGVVKTEGFEFTVTENNCIHVSVPDATTFKGTYPLAGVASKNPTALADLNVKISLDEESVFTPDGAGAYTNYSMLWSELEVTELANPNESTGIIYGNAAITNGMRHIIPNGASGLCVLVSNSFAQRAGTKVASNVFVILFDGTFEDATDKRPGYRWSFLARNHADTANGDATDISRGYEYVDLSEGLEFNVREDSTLGYVVSVNGKEYSRGYEVGYFPNDCKLNDSDYVDVSEAYINSMTYAQKDIDLSVLNGVSEGYLVIGAVGNSRNEPNMNYTIDTVNHQPAATWTGHSHTWGEDTVTVPANCTEAGSVTRTCTECGYAENRELPAVGHTLDGEKFNKVDATCSSAGSYDRICKVCGDTQTYYTRMLYHVYDDDWTVVVEPTYLEPGYKIRYCTNGCGTSEMLPIATLENPFEDVADGKWYTTGILYCYQYGYMEGIGTADSGKAVFSYKATMDRQMFVTVLAKIDGVDLSGYTSAPFTDVADGKWYTAAIAWAAENEYASGIGDGVFGRKNPVTREQLALFFYVYAEKNGVDVSKTADLSKYDDLGSVHSWALNAMGWAVDAGLISGTSDTTLSPRESGTRAEVSLIVMNFVEDVLGTETPVE